jgi:hypothetical protein
MVVKNINGTSDKDCSCGSWLKHCEKHSKQTRIYCVAIGCVNKAEYGAHVQKDDSTDQNWYIVPFCPSCNKQTGKIKIDDSVILVPAIKD